jgi:hypothetical protein
MEMTEMLLTKEEQEWIEEIRAVRSGHEDPNTRPQFFSFAANDNVADTVGAMAEMVLDAEDMGEGDLFAVVVQVSAEPHKRRAQYMMMLQLVEQKFGPRDGEEFQVYFDPKLQLN